MQPSAPAVKLSIIVPCYNSGDYLPRCLDSLLSQTLDKLEIVCVNDGSTDNTLDILRAYERENPGLVRTLSIENRGIWNARWAGVNASQGELVTFVDSDDFVSPDFAQSFWEVFVREESDLVVCGFKRVEGNDWRSAPIEMAKKRPPFLPADEPGRLIEINPATWNKAFSRDLLERMPSLSNQPEILEDVAFSQLAFLAAKRPIAFTGKSSYYYMVHGSSNITSVTPEQVEGVKRMLLEVREDFEADGASAEMLQALDATAFLHLGVSMSFRLSGTPGTNLKSMIAQTTCYLDEHFPTWRHSPFITPAYAHEHGSSYQKLLLARWFYKAHLMRPFLACYRFAIERLGVDIKW